ncbi:MAG: hypothetical protein U0941_13700 [Planctomycetaceae bacterium]
MPSPMHVAFSTMIGLLMSKHQPNWQRLQRSPKFQAAFEAAVRSQANTLFRQSSRCNSYLYLTLFEWLIDGGMRCSTADEIAVEVCQNLTDEQELSRAIKAERAYLRKSVALQLTQSCSNTPWALLNASMREKEHGVFNSWCRAKAKTVSPRKFHARGSAYVASDFFQCLIPHVNLDLAARVAWCRVDHLHKRIGRPLVNDPYLVRIFWNGLVENHIPTLEYAMKLQLGER